MPSRALQRSLPWLLGAALLLGLGEETAAWLTRNGLPDGYQNEYLHVGNALDLWGALVDRDGWHLRYYLSTNYWPPGFYVWPWPLFKALGATHRAMVLANLGHLAVLLGAVWGLARPLGGRFAGAAAMLTMAIWPSVFGNLTRYEPNLAALAWVTLGALMLQRSNRFTHRRSALGFGLVCGVGLLMDRLTLGAFLVIPAAVEWGLGLAERGLGPGERRARLLHGLGAVAVVLAVSGWWHVAFVQHHLEEILSQGGVGEIDETGAITESHSALGQLLYYPATLLDGQAGLVPGAWALLALAWALPGLRDRRRVPLTVVLTGTALFTLVAKKQVYYTIPMLGCLAVVAAERLAALGRGRWPVGAVVLLAGVHQHGWRMWRSGLPMPERAAAWVGGPSLPEAWVAPRHPQARPPRDLRLPVDALAASLPPGEVIVFSEDQTWFEGFLVLQLRERRGGGVRGVIGDPQGTFEWFNTARGFIYVSADGTPGWPSEARLEALMEQHHYSLEALPPVIETVRSGRDRYHMVAWWPLEGGGRVSAWVRG
ncbi:MAG: hypothetical protein H6739_36455 [Alphaproteobacteria bacterium]|nr:hypothetical protein [Alphaproteobacteria bacterium]